MTTRVRCAEAALQIVRDGPGPLETITRGNSAVKTAATTARIPSALSAKAKPTRPRRTRIPDTAKASPHAAASAIGTAPPNPPGPWDPAADSQTAGLPTGPPAGAVSHKAT